MNGLYLVCDGGGTKTDFLLFEKTGRVRGRAQGAGANANFVPPAEAAHTVYAGVMECLAQAGAAPAQVREFVLFIPGFRPGKPTADFIHKVLNKITLFGAIYLGIVAICPLLLGKAVGNAYLAIGGTSVIIVVGVALETVKALEAQMLMRQYKGFLE